MLTTAIVLAVIGILLFWVGWLLNTQTPVQQPLPMVGIAFLFAALVFFLLWF